MCVKLKSKLWKIKLTLLLMMANLSRNICSNSKAKLVKIISKKVIILTRLMY